MKARKQTLREVRDAALHERIVAQSVGARVRELIDDPLRPVGDKPVYYRGALVRRPPR